MSKIVFFALVVAAALALPTVQKENALSNRVVFGLLSQPVSEEVNSEVQLDNYIAASYVKFLEASGARVVPLPFNASAAQLDDMLSGLNGVLFPGGGASLEKSSQFYQAAEHIFKRVIEANDAGDYMPIWGTCLGFEAIGVIVSQNFSLLTTVDSYNISLALHFTPQAPKSKLFSGAPANVIDALATKAITFNNHMWGISPESFAAEPKLVSFFDVLSTNKDRAGKEFISAMEGKKYPVYAAQFHPEKAQFEWNIDEVIPHSSEAVRAMQYIGDYIVNEARKNSRRYKSDDVLRSRLIYQYTPVFTGKPGASFEQTYYNIHYA